MTNKDVLDNGNPLVNHTKPWTNWSRKTTKTVEEDTPGNRDLLANAEMSNWQDHYLQTQQTPCRKKHVHHDNRTSQATKATLFKGNLIEPLNQGGTTNDKDPLPNEETPKLLNRLSSIDTDNHHPVPRNAHRIKIDQSSYEVPNPSQGQMLISITKDLSQMQILSDQSNNKQRNWDDMLQPKTEGAKPSLTTSTHHSESSKHTDQSSNDWPLEVQGTNPIELQSAYTSGSLIDHETDMIEWSYDITSESLIIPQSTDLSLMKQTLNAETHITNPCGLSDSRTPGTGAISLMPSAKKALPTILSINKCSVMHGLCIL